MSWSVERRDEKLVSESFGRSAAFSAVRQVRWAASEMKSSRSEWVWKVLVISSEFVIVLAISMKELNIMKNWW